jgi:predicted glycosyltransferase
MFYVQHLLGVGHLKRASVLARSMAEAGLDVAVVLGGPEVPGISFDGCARVLLPPVRALDETFQVLVDEGGKPIDDAWRDHRMARLLAEFEAYAPHLLLIELFPFGRQRFRFELMPLLETARTSAPSPRIVCSVRDILVRKADTARNQEMVAVARAWFDHVLVHGDPGLIRLEASLPEAAAIAEKLIYTGYVVEETDADTLAPERESGRGEVIVTVGGGAVGEPLLRAALAARPLTRFAAQPWRLITGPNLADGVYDELASTGGPGVVVERWRADVPILLRNCLLSISQGGYNTIMDILRARARAVVVPFAVGNETEQTLRARLLADRGLIAVVDPDQLSGESLARAVDAAPQPPSRVADIDLSGARRTARIVAGLCTGTTPGNGVDRA